MAKFKCVCGETIRISGPIPNPVEWLYVSDVEFDQISAGKTIDTDLLSSRLQSAYRCPVSGHLWFFKDGEARPYGYAPIER